MKRTWIFAFIGILALSIVVPATLTFAKSRKPTEVERKTPSVAELRTNYVLAKNGNLNANAKTKPQKVRILIVPGHEPTFGGAIYQGVYEREITVEIADQLAAYLEQNPALEVTVARSSTAWHAGLETYFKKHWNSIQDFVTDKKIAFKKLVKKGKISQRTDEDQVAHAAADPDAALRLYGINKWADEQGFDLVVHLHINDTTDHGPNTPSAQSGFAVYVPDEQYQNASTSRALGEDIAVRLAAMNGTSTLPIESRGVVPDQQLIALGAYKSLTVPSVLIEYAYITEAKFTHPEVRETVTKDFAYETYLGLQDFFGDPVVARFPTATLPHRFSASSTVALGASSPEVYALQAALHTLGLYPPATTTIATGMMSAATTTQTLSDCPISGLMGPCTVSAINAFQKSKGLEMKGVLSSETISRLNAAFK